MAVLVEGISVIIRADRLLDVVAGEWDAFRRMVPNDTLCADGELARVGFLSPTETEKFCIQLEQLGLEYQPDGKALDFTVADQQKGLMIPTDWAEVGTISWQGRENRPVRACRLKGSGCHQLVTPDGWKWEASLSKEFLFVPTFRHDS